MRKHLLFFFALCALCRVAVAQGVAFADLDEGKYYYLKSGRKTTSNSWFRGYVVMKDDGTNLTLRGVSNAYSGWNVSSKGFDTELDESTADKSAMWGVIKYTDINGASYVIIYNAQNGKCFKSTAALSDALAKISLVDEVGYYKLEPMTADTYTEENSYRLRNVSTQDAGHMFSMAPGQTEDRCVSAYNTNGNPNDGGVPLRFIEVPASNPNSTFNSTLRKQVGMRDVYGTARIINNAMTDKPESYTDATYTALKTALTTFRSTPTFANRDALQTALDAIDPLQNSDDFCYEIYHYKFGQTQGRGMMAYDASRTNEYPATVGVTYTNYNNYKNPGDDGINTLWGLYKNADNTYYVYNEGNAARLITSTAPSTWSDAPVKMTITSNSAHTGTYLIKGASNENRSMGISLGYSDGGDIRLQDNNTDDACPLLIRIAGRANTDAQDIVRAMLRRVEYPVEYKDYVGGLPTEVNVTGDNRTVENANAILAAQPMGIDPTKHYRIISNLRSKAISTTEAFANTTGTLDASIADSRKVFTKTYTDADIASLCQFVPTGTEGLYNIRMDNAALCLGAFNSGTCEIPTAENQTAANLSVLSLVEQEGLDHHIWTLRVGTDATADSYLNAWNGSGEEGLGAYQLGSPVGDGNKWKIQLVESVPVTLSTAGWTTKCFPFAVNIPEGVHAYYATSIQGTEIYVKEFTDVIPAGAPVLLNGTAGAVLDFVINTEDNSTNPEENILTGTTLRRSGFTAGDVYGLKITDTEAAFVPANTTAVPANKAVLASSLVPATDPAMEKALRLNFGEPTGISETVTIAAEGNQAIFDMAGRRVDTLRHGVVYVKANGQKFILK